MAVASMLAAADVDAAIAACQGKASRAPLGLPPGSHIWENTRFIDWHHVHSDIKRDEPNSFLAGLYFLPVSDDRV